MVRPMCVVERHEAVVRNWQVIESVLAEANRRPPRGQEGFGLGSVGFEPVGVQVQPVVLDPFPVRKPVRTGTVAASVATGRRPVILASGPAAWCW